MNILEQDHLGEGFRQQSGSSKVPCYPTNPVLVTWFYEGKLRQAYFQLGKSYSSKEGLLSLLSAIKKEKDLSYTIVALWAGQYRSDIFTMTMDEALNFLLEG